MDFIYVVELSSVHFSFQLTTDSSLHSLQIFVRDRLDVKLLRKLKYIASPIILPVN